MKPARAFTLIEILVVIAIVSILAAIILPVFASAREKSRQITCVSNERQLGLAVTQYLQDYDEQFPGATDGETGASVHGGWIYYSVFGADTPAVFDPTLGALYSYVKNTQIYACPDDSPGQTNGDSYAINSCVEASAQIPVGSGYRPGVGLSRIRMPSGIMLFGEESAAQRTTNDGFQNLSSGDSFTNRHIGGTNVDFVDGHVKWYRTENIHVLGLQSGTPNETTTTPCP